MIVANKQKNDKQQVDADNIPLAIVKFFTPSKYKNTFIERSITNMYVKYFLTNPFSSNV